MGFSAGVTVLISFVELLVGGIESIGFLQIHLGFFAGISRLWPECRRREDKDLYHRAKTS
ncbi:MAG: hypothetical protein AMJ92_06310 [candidate division Zixibacteria bacterium SM23_81]|nr:MAG: hypothetical protein AMJ92_06310 [candidate division Zixibacteria bacterium SM23_81]